VAVKKKRPAFAKAGKKAKKKAIKKAVKREPKKVKKKAVKKKAVKRDPILRTPDQQTALAQQRYALRGVATEMSRNHPVEAAVTVSANRDGSVDGELRIFNIRHGYTIHDLLIDLGMYLWGRPAREPDSEYALPADHYVSIGALTDWGTRENYEEAYARLLKEGFSPEEASAEARKIASPLPRYRGLGRVGMYPVETAGREVSKSGNLKNVPTMILNAQRLFERQKKRGKPKEILVRAFWNHGDAPSPERIRRLTGKRKREVLATLKLLMKRRNRGGG